MSNLQNQFIKDSYQNLLQITSSNAVEKGDGTSVTALAITSSTTAGVAPAITGNTNNRILTATGGQTINGEANLTFDGSTLSVTGEVNTQVLNVSSNVNSNLLPPDATYSQTLGDNTHPWNQVYVGTSDGTRTAFFGEDIANNPGKIAIRTDYDLIIRGQGGVNIEGTTTIATLQNDTLTNNLSISTPSLTATNLRATNSASIGGNFVPQARLHISGANNQALLEIDSPAVNNILFVSGSGRIGIGTTTPITTLDVVGSINASGFVASANVFTNVVRGYLTASFGAPGIDFPTTAVVHISGASNDNLLRVSSPTTTGLFVSGSGNVGIGTTNPINRLQIVGGNIALDATRHIDWGSGNSRITDLGLTTGQGYPITISTFGPIAAGASNSLTEKLRLTGSGSLGLGTTNPLARLHVSGSDGNDFLRVTSGSQNILNVRSGSAVFFAGTGVSPTANFDLDVQGTGTANGGSVRFAGNSTIWTFTGTSTVSRTGTGNTDMFNVTLGGTSTTAIQNPMKVEFNANQNPTSGSGYTVLRVNATHATTAGTGSKLLQTWEFGGTQRSVVNITGSIGVGITTPSASVHISSSLGLAPILAITPHHPLPTTNIPTGSFMVSASVPPRPYMWDGTSWYAL